MKSADFFPFDQIGQRLKRLRKEFQNGPGPAGMTQADAARLIGINERTYKDWERGRTAPDAARLGAIADLYGVSVDYLLCRSDCQTVDGAAVSRITGLSSAAVDYLSDDYRVMLNNFDAWGNSQTVREFAREFIGPCSAFVLSDLIENSPGCFDTLIKDMHRYLWHTIESADLSDEQQIFENEQSIASDQYKASVSLANLLTDAAENMIKGS